MYHIFQGQTTSLRYRDGVLYSQDGKLLSRPKGSDEGRLTFETDIRNGVPYKGNNPREVKVVFGHGCNFSCHYCSQKGAGDHGKEQKKQQDVIAWMRENLDLSRLEQIELWGGETLLYWKSALPVMLAFDNPDMDFVIPTNGSLLTPEIISRLCALQGRTTIELSHDGPYQSSNRGKDPLPGLVGVFRAIADNPHKVRIQITAVMTHDRNDFTAVNDYFRDYFLANDLPPVKLNFMPVVTYRDGQGGDLTTYRENLNAYLRGLTEQFREKGRVMADRYLESSLFHVREDGDDNFGILQMAQMMGAERDVHPSSVCGLHRSDVLVIDQTGAVRSCQNGTVVEGKSIPYRTDLKMAEREKCQTCPVRIQCWGGCLLPIPDQEWEINCAMSYTHNLTMLERSLSIIAGQDMTYMGAGE